MRSRLVPFAFVLAAASPGFAALAGAPASADPDVAAYRQNLANLRASAATVEVLRLPAAERREAAAPVPPDPAPLFADHAPIAGLHFAAPPGNGPPETRAVDGYSVQAPHREFADSIDAGQDVIIRGRHLVSYLPSGVVAFPTASVKGNDCGETIPLAVKAAAADGSYVVLAFGRVRLPTAAAWSAAAQPYLATGVTFTLQTASGVTVGQTAYHPSYSLTTYSWLVGFEPPAAAPAPIDAWLAARFRLGSPATRTYSASDPSANAGTDAFASPADLGRWYSVLDYYVDPALDALPPSIQPDAAGRTGRPVIGWKVDADHPFASYWLRMEVVGPDGYRAFPFMPKQGGACED